jgi:hypothetical protein
MSEPPILLSKWYEYTKWLLGRVDQFPKNQRFILGQRLVDTCLEVQECLIEGAYTRGGAEAEPFVRREPEDRGAPLARPAGS